MLLPIEFLTPSMSLLTPLGPRALLNLRQRTHHGEIVGLRAGHGPVLWLTTSHLVRVSPRPRSLGGRRDWSATPLMHLPRRQELRREATAMEQRLWSRLRREQLGVKFRRQHPIGPYIVDFYSREVHLVIEVDGDSHFLAGAEAYDAARTEYLQSIGIEVLRFTNHDVATHLETVVEAIWECCRSREAGRPVWLAADDVTPGDVVFCGEALAPVAVDEVLRETGEVVVWELVVQRARAVLTEVCCVADGGEL